VKALEPCLRWFVVYTYPKMERKVHSKIIEMGTESFLPLQKVVKQWSDRKKKLEVPLFPNYVFVRITPNKSFDLLKIREVVRFLTIEGRPVAVTENEINSIKKILAGDSEIHDEKWHPFYQIGEKIKIRHGRFSGIEGYLVRRSGKNRVMIQVDALKKAVSIDIPEYYTAEVV
jgi:transcription antitermination factor NusG